MKKHLSTPVLFNKRVAVKFHRNFIKNSRRTPTEDELICCLMGKVGFSGKHIVKQTGLTLRQVYRTLMKAHIKLWDFRHGRTGWGRAVANTCVDRAGKEFKLLGG